MRRMTAPSALESQYFCTQPRAPDDPRELEPLPFLRANTSLHEFQTKKRLKSQAAAKARADANNGAPRADGSAAARTGAHAMLVNSTLPSRVSQAGADSAGGAGASAGGAGVGMGGGTVAGGGSGEAARPPPPTARREHGARGGSLPEVDRTVMAVAATASHYPQHSGPLWLDPHHAIERDGQTRAAHSGGGPHSAAAARYHPSPQPPAPLALAPPHVPSRR